MMLRIPCTVQAENKLAFVAFELNNSKVLLKRFQSNSAGPVYAWRLKVGYTVLGEEIISDLSNANEWLVFFGSDCGNAGFTSNPIGVEAKRSAGVNHVMAT